MTDKMIAVPDVDRLSNIIREANGKNDLGAGALAERIVEALLREAVTPAQQGWQRMTDRAREMQRQHLDNHNGDVYHAMQSLCAGYGAESDEPLTQPADKELRRDAERYRWARKGKALRVACTSTGGRPLFIHFAKRYDCADFSSRYDEAIDDAIAAEKGKNA